MSRSQRDHTAAPAKPALRRGLTSNALAAATARYSTTADLRKLLTYDEERGGIPIRLLSARWLLTYFQDSVTIKGHAGFTCDRSGMNPIVGIRYNLRGENYDLCQAEYDKLSEGEKAQYDAIQPPPQLLIKFPNNKGTMGKKGRPRRTSRRLSEEGMEDEAASMLRDMEQREGYGIYHQGGGAGSFGSGDKSGGNKHVPLNHRPVRGSVIGRLFRGSAQAGSLAK